MRPLLASITFMVLASAGFFAGRMLSVSFRQDGVDRLPVVRESIPSPTEMRDPGDARDPRTGRDFRQSLEQVGLRKVAGGGSFRGRELYEDDRPGKRLLDLERAFALASEEDLLAFFSEIDPTELGDDTLSAAYFRFGQIDIDKALSIWSDEFRRNGTGAGIDGLVKSWAGSDSQAAERWVDALPVGKIQEEALAALLVGALNTSPDLVERRIVEIDSSTCASFLANELAKRADTDQLSSLADRFLAEKRDFWQYQNQLYALLVEWSERDGAAMTTWLAARPEGEIHDNVVARIAESRASIDPAAFAREIGPSLASSPALAEMAGFAFLKWLDQANDDDGALAWLAENGKNLKLPSETQNASPGSRQWSAEDAGRVLTEFSALPDVDRHLRLTLAQTLLDQLADTDPLSALSLGQEYLPAGTQKELFLANAIARSGDFEEGLEWALQNLVEGEERTNAVRYALSSLAKSKPTAALERATVLPEPMRKTILDGIASLWAQHSPEEVIEYLGNTRDPAIQASIARSAFWRLGNRGGSEADLTQALGLPDETVKAEAVGALFRGWTEVNLESSGAALNALEPGPLRDIAITEFVRNASRTDRNAALAWSLEIVDPQKRREVTLGQGRDWLSSNREAATRWIESSEDLPAEWKAELLKKGK